MSRITNQEIKRNEKIAEEKLDLFIAAMLGLEKAKRATDKEIFFLGSANNLSQCVTKEKDKFIFWYDTACANGMTTGCKTVSKEEILNYKRSKK